jgi:hypothetical protein
MSIPDLKWCHCFLLSLLQRTIVTKKNARRKAKKKKKDMHLTICHSVNGGLWIRLSHTQPRSLLAIPSSPPSVILASLCYSRPACSRHISVGTDPLHAPIFHIAASISCHFFEDRGIPCRNNPSIWHAGNQFQDWCWCNVPTILKSQTRNKNKNKAKIRNRPKEWERVSGGCKYQALRVFSLALYSFVDWSQGMVFRYLVSEAAHPCAQRLLDNLKRVVSREMENKNKEKIRDND